MAKYVKKYSYKGYKIKETPEGTFDIFKPSWDPNDPIFEELSSIESAKEWIISDIKLDQEETLEESDMGGGSMSGGTGPFAADGGSSTYDANAFKGKKENMVKKIPPYTICAEDIKKNVIRPLVERYLEKYLN